MNRGIRQALAGRSVEDVYDPAMPVINILPHAEYCPQGDEIEAAPARRSARRCWKTASRSSTPAR